MENKTNNQGIVKGAMILGVGVFASRIIGLLYRIPITNIIGDVGNGLYSMAFNVYAVILTLTAISMPSALSKLIAEREAVGAYKEAHRVYKIALFYAVLASGCLAVVMWFGAGFISTVLFSEKDVSMPIRALAPTVVIATVIAVMRGYFQGQNNMFPTAFSQIIEQIFNVVFSVLLAYFLVKYGVIIAVTGSTLGTGIGALSGLSALLIIFWWMGPKQRRKMKHSTDGKHESSGAVLKQILVMMGPVIVSTSVFSIMTLIDTSMATKMLPSSIDYLKAHSLFKSIPIPGAESLPTGDIVKNLIGQFSIKYYTLLNVPVSLVIQLGGAAMPAIAASVAVKDYKDVRRKTKLIFKTGMLVGAPSAAGMMLFAGPIIALLFSEPTGAKLLSSGAVGIVFIALAQLSAGVLQGMGKPNIPTINAVIACIVKVVINFALLSVPQLHIYAVIHSTTICYLIYALLNIQYLRKHLHMHLNWQKILIRPVISAAVMGLLSYGIFRVLMLIWPNQKVWVLVIIPIAMVIYLLAGIATRAITKNDLLHFPGGSKLIKLLHG